MRQISSPRRQRGYTLIELLAYIAVLAFFSAVLVSGTIVLIQSFARVRAVRNLSDAGGLALERMVREIRQAQSVDDAGSIFNQTPGRLKLNTTTAAGDPTTVEFAVGGDDLTLKLDDGAAVELLSGQAAVSSLIFRKLATSTALAVKIEASFTDDRLPAMAPVSFDTTVVLRGSY